MCRFYDCVAVWGAMRGFINFTTVLLVSAFVLSGLGEAANANITGDGASILIYHRFGERGLPSTNIRLDQFDAHLQELSNETYNVMSLPNIVSAFEKGSLLPDRTLAITIDDAFLSVYTEAWPRLKKAGFPFTLFVSTGPIDNGTAGYMTWNHLRELVADGVTIGHHSVTHRRMHELSAAENIKEIETANKRFLKELGIVPVLFSYPFGEYTPSVRDIVEAAGFRAAFGQHSGVAHNKADLLTLPRFSMNEKYGSIIRFRLVVNALPLPVSEVIPADPYLVNNPPVLGFTVAPNLGDLARLSCFASHESKPARLERLGERRIEVRLSKSFPPGRGRVNCTLPASDGRWRWFGIQFIVSDGVAETN